MQRPSRWILSAGALLGVTGVVLGAYGAHGLDVDAVRRGSWSVAVQYQLFHAVTLLTLGVWYQSTPSRWLSAAVLFILVGVLLFSGSIYALTLFGASWLGPVTPLGGVGLIVGWSLLLGAIWRVRD